MPRDRDEEIKRILEKSKVIAVVGHSDKPSRTSHQIAGYLRQAGYKVYAVNPAVDRIDGEKAYPHLKDLPEKVDIVNVFRRSEHLAGVVKEAAAIGAENIWAQLGVYDREAAEIGAAAGIVIIMDKCIKVEHQRLGLSRK